MAEALFAVWVAMLSATVGGVLACVLAVGVLIEAWLDWQSDYYPHYHEVDRVLSEVNHDGSG